MLSGSAITDPENVSSWYIQLREKGYGVVCPVKNKGIDDLFLQYMEPQQPGGFNYWIVTIFYNDAGEEQLRVRRRTWRDYNWTGTLEEIRKYLSKYYELYPKEVNND